MQSRRTFYLTCACVLAGALAGSAHAFSLDTVAGRGVGDRKPAKRAGLLAPTGVTMQGVAALITDSQHARVRKVKNNGKIVTFAGTYPGTFGDFAPASAVGLKVPTKSRVAPNGDVLIAEYGSDRVRRIVNDTAVPVAGVPDDPGFSGDGGPATEAQLDGPSDASQDDAGNVYIADSRNHRIRKIDAVTGNISTIAGTGAPGYAGNGGLAKDAQLNTPVCVLPGPGGALYVCDYGNHAIRRIDPDGVIRGVAGKGEAGFSGDGKKAKKALLDHPTDVAFEANGNIIIADSGNQRVRRINVQGRNPRMSTIAGNGQEGFTGTGVPALSPLGDPTGVTVHPDGRILIAEASNDRVRALVNLQTLVNFAGDGVGTFGGDGGAARKAQFSAVHGVNVDALGNILIADYGNYRIRKVDVATGKVTTLAGTGSPDFSGDGGPATSAGLSVSDIVVDALGNVIFSDTMNNRVRRIDALGTITTIVGTGVAGFAGDGGDATDAQIDAPTGVALDGAGNLYVADFLNDRIRRVDKATGKISTVAGNGGTGFDGDGKAATSASLNNPTDVAFLANGDMLIADFRNHRVRLVSGGQISTYAGTGTSGDNSDGPLAPSQTQLSFPSDVQVDASGNVFVADSGNDKIREVLASDGGMRTIAGTGLTGLVDADDALDGRMAVPLRIHLLGDGSMVVADSQNFVIRMLQP